MESVNKVSQKLSELRALKLGELVGDDEKITLLTLEKN